MSDCDLLIVESRTHGTRWGAEATAILEEMEALRRRVPALAYLDTSDSTALLHPEVLPHVDVYFKAQLLRERQRYAQPYYGHRVFADFVHERYGIVDAEPAWSTPVRDERLLCKLHLSWNAGLADYSWGGRYRMALFARLPCRWFLRVPRHWTSPRGERPVDVSCRMTVNYARATVAWHRNMARQRLARWAAAGRVAHRHYIRELRRAQVTVSPFGWGEINYKDFEAFLAGSALVKPDMSHLQTWPDLYRAGETMVAYRWDGEDLVDQIERLLDDKPGRIAIAEAGQSAYRHALSGRDAPAAFGDRITHLLAVARASAAARGGG